ncbi:cation:proton antiporter [Candidatus Woesearchaeota archaeon]|nr:cation:proton antiporter [Candidatus Woesearchaeota archaeon]
MATELISLGILFVCAIVGGIIANRFRQPAVFGLLLVGALIGPSSLNMVKDADMISIMADFGAILILFIIGLEFDVSKLLKLGARSMLIGLLKFAIVLFLGYEATLLLGFSVKIALFIGVILSFSSTVVVVKVLEQKEMFTRKEVPLLIAILIIEDIIAVFALTFFSGIKDASSGLLNVFEHIVFSLGALILAYLVMMRLLRFIVNIIMKNNSDESVLIFLSLAMGALFSYFALYLGLTPSAGAFLAGSLIASLPNAKDYGRAIHPYALIFTSIFFISMGTLVDLSVVKENAFLIASLIVIVLVSRLIAIGFLTYLLANFKDEQPVFSSIAMISVGEFSLLIAKESQKFNVGIDLVTITASIIFLTALLTSLGLNYSEKLHSSLNSRVPVRTRLKLERLSNYMRKLFDQMEIENFFTNKLRKESRAACMLLVFALFVTLISRRISFEIKYRYHILFLYGFYVLISMILLYIGKLIYRKFMEIYQTLSAILTHVDASRNIKKCNSILNNLLVTLVLFFSAMLFPFVIFMFNLGTLANLMPFVLAVAAFYYLKRLVVLIDGPHQYTPSYNAGIAISKL